MIFRDFWRDFSDFLERVVEGKREDADLLIEEKGR